MNPAAFTLTIMYVMNLVLAPLSSLIHQVGTGVGGRRSLHAPPFFTSQHDKSFKGEFFPAGSEAERRISLFVQSLTTNFLPPLPIDVMPTFTVLTPHCSEGFIFFYLVLLGTCR